MISNKFKIYYPINRRKWEDDLIMELSKDFVFLSNKINDTYPLKIKKINFVSYIFKISHLIYKFFFKSLLPIRSITRGNFNFIISSQIFVKCKSHIPYVVYIENAHSIFAYDWSNYAKRKHKNKLSKLIKQNIQKSNFKGFVFFSEESRKIFYSELSNFIPEGFKNLGTIYPFTYDNKNINEKLIIEKSKTIKNRKVRLLYISSQFHLKGGAEILEFLKRNPKSFSITIITDLKSLDQNTLNLINSVEEVYLLEQDFSSFDLHSIFLNHDILLHPTFLDSTAIVVMEALKSGLPVIATNTFAIKEYVENSVNGFLIENPFKFYDINYKINKPYDFYCGQNTPKYLNEFKKNNIYLTLVESLDVYIKKVVNNYEYFALNALKNSRESFYSENSIISSWKKIIYQNSKIPPKTSGTF